MRDRLKKVLEAPGVVDRVKAEFVDIWSGVG